MSEVTAEAAVDIVTAMYEEDPLVRALGISIVSVELGRVELALEPALATLNSLDMVHGGVLYILADTAFAYSFASHGCAGVTTQGVIAYLSPAESGMQLHAVATEIHRTAKIGIYDVMITDVHGTDIAAFRGQGQIPRRRSI